MEDRVSRHPYRIHLKAVPNKPDYFDVELADEPIKEGTPYNVASVLPEPLAKQFGLNSKTGTVAQVLDKLTNSVFGDNPAMLKNLKGEDIHPIWSTAYKANGQYPVKVEIPFVPRFVISIGVGNGEAVAVSYNRGGQYGGTSITAMGKSGLLKDESTYIDGTTLIHHHDPGGAIAKSHNLSGYYDLVVAFR